MKRVSRHCFQETPRMSYLAYKLCTICSQHPLCSTLISHPSPLASNFPPVLCFLQFPELSLLFHTSLLLHMLFHLSGMPLDGKRNPRLFFQPIPTQCIKTRASPGKPTTNSSKPSAPTRPGCRCCADLHELFIQAQIHRARCHEGPHLIRMHFWNWSRRVLGMFAREKHSVQSLEAESTHMLGEGAAVSHAV